MVHVLARIVVKPENAAAARTVLEKLVDESRKEPGCVSYLLYQQTKAPHVFQTVEEWKSQADVDAHLKSPHLGAAVAAAGAFFAAAPEILDYAKLK